MTPHAVRLEELSLVGSRLTPQIKKEKINSKKQFPLHYFTQTVNDWRQYHDRAMILHILSFESRTNGFIRCRQNFISLIILGFLRDFAY